MALFRKCINNNKKPCYPSQTAGLYMAKLMLMYEIVCKDTTIHSNLQIFDDSSCFYDIFS